MIKGRDLKMRKNKFLVMLFVVIVLILIKSNIVTTIGEDSETSYIATEIIRPRHDNEPHI